MARKHKPQRLSSAAGHPAEASTAAASSASAPATGDSGPLYFFGAGNASRGFLSQWFDRHPFTDPGPLAFSRPAGAEEASTEQPVVYRTAEHYMMHSKARLFGDAEAAAQILAAWSPREAKRLGRAVRGFDPATWDREKTRIVRRGTWCKFSYAQAGEDADEGGEKSAAAVVEGEDEDVGKRKQPGEGGSPAGEEEGTTGGRRGMEEEATQNQDPDQDQDKAPGRSHNPQTTWYLGTDGQACTMQAASFREALLRTGDRELVEASPFDRIWGIGFGAANAERNRSRWGQNLLGKALMEVRAEFQRELIEQQAREDGEMREGDAKQP